MSNYEAAYTQAAVRANGFAFHLERDDGDEDQDAAVATVIGISDVEGRAMLVEVGTGPDGVFASVSGFADDEPAEVRVFASDNVAMLIVDAPVDEREPE